MDETDPLSPVGRWTGNNFLFKGGLGCKRTSRQRSTKDTTVSYFVQIAAKKDRPSIRQVITGRSPVTPTAGPSESDQSGE